jgi:hypothetical protein
VLPSSKQLALAAELDLQRCAPPLPPFAPADE